MQYTTNYSLKKPQYADEADIEIINDNTDDVDSLIHQNRTMIAPAFDNTKAYVTGDPVEYLGALYVFTADKAAGAWDASKVEPTTAAEMGGGGASALVDLDDVEITSPTKGQALLYDDQNDEWVNSDLPDASVTKEASGNPIEIIDGADAPLVKCVTAITGYQEGTGTPSPENVRPITAYTEGEIEVVGKNLLDPSLIELQSNGYMWSNNYQTQGTISVKPSTTYTLCFDHGIGDGRIYFYDENGNSAGKTWTFTNPSTTFPTPSTCVSIGFRYKTDNNVTPTISNAKPMLYYGSSTATYEPYVAPTTHTTTYPSAIYRGSEDVVNGEVTSEWKKVIFDGSIDEIWGLQGINSYGIANFQYYMNNAGGAYEKGFITNYLPAQNTLIANTQTEGFLTNTSILYVRLLATRASTVEEFRTFLSTHPLELAYEQATPTTSSVTPTNLPIKSLSGYSHIESSTGEMEIEYITKTYEPLVELIEASDHIYSTQEQVVGTWVDGKTLYEKTIVKQNISSASSSTVLIPSSELTGMNIVEIGGSYVSRTTASTYPINAYINSNTIIATWLAEGDIYYWLYWGAADTYDAYITIRYTKSSSNNRSLSKGGGEQEVKEEPTEETKEEPKEETKEENENNEAER